MNTPKLDCQGNWDSESVNSYTSLEHIKKHLYRGNWSYLSRHPEINQQLKRVNENLKQNRWSQYDGETIFSKVASTHSLLSRSSIGIDMDNMLRYAMLMRNQK